MTTTNQNLSAEVLALNYQSNLTTVFARKSAFQGTLADLQSYDGINENATAFELKTSDTPVVIGTYDATKNPSQGESRFGAITEVIYSNTPVVYNYAWAFNELIDEYTVNHHLSTAVADRLALQALARADQHSVELGAYLLKNAGDTESLKDYSDSAVLALFNAVQKYKIKTRIARAMTAYVSSDLYAAIVDSPYSTSGKHSTVDIDKNTATYFKGFAIEETSDDFLGGSAALFAPDKIVLPFVGIEKVRTVATDKALGLLLQGVGKGGHFVLDDNKKAIIKVAAPK